MFLIQYSTFIIACSHTLNLMKLW